jgi:hypothetical protein
MGGLQKGIEKNVSKVWLPVRKVIDPLNIMDPFNILPDAKLRGKKRFSFDPEYGGALAKALKGPTRPYVPPKMDFSKYQMPQLTYDPSGFISQVQQGNQATTSLKSDVLGAKNAAQQANINSILAQSKPNNFSSPNLSGLTFGGK